MADENTSSDDAINALFGSTPPAEPPAEPPKSDEGDGEWRPGYVPKAFRAEDGTLRSMDELTKSWYDGRQHITTLSARVKELEAAGAAGVSETFEQYHQAMDWDALAEKAPNAYRGGGAENQAAMGLLQALHNAGVPDAKAHAAVAEYYTTLNGMVPEVKDEETLRKEAVAHLGPNGTSMAEEVKGFLQAKARQHPFNEQEMEVIGQMVNYGPGLSVLWQLSRQAGSTAPPTATGAADTRAVDPEQAKKDVFRKLGTLDEAQWAANKDAIIAEWRQANPDKAA